MAATPRVKGRIKVTSGAVDATLTAVQNLVSAASRHYGDVHSGTDAEDGRPELAFDVACRTNAAQTALYNGLVNLLQNTPELRGRVSRHTCGHARGEGTVGASCRDASFVESVRA